MTSPCALPARPSPPTRIMIPRRQSTRRSVVGARTPKQPRNTSVRTRPRASVESRRFSDGQVVGHSPLFAWRVRQVGDAVQITRARSLTPISCLDTVLARSPRSLVALWRDDEECSEDSADEQKDPRVVGGSAIARGWRAGGCRSGLWSNGFRRNWFRCDWFRSNGRR